MRRSVLGKRGGIGQTVQMIEIVRIPALSDNYIWLVHEPSSSETLVIDPAEAAPVLAEAEARGELAEMRERHLLLWEESERRVIPPLAT